jgi:hypothetical protein
MGEEQRNIMSMKWTSVDVEMPKLSHPVGRSKKLYFSDRLIVCVQHPNGELEVCFGFFSGECWHYCSGYDGEWYDCTYEEAGKVLYWMPLPDLPISPISEFHTSKNGKWLWSEKNYTYSCSVCHCDFDYCLMYDLFDHGFQYAAYCPNCGAKMSGE